MTKEFNAPLSGTVEVDECFVGPKPMFQHADKTGSDEIGGGGGNGSGGDGGGGEDEYRVKPSMNLGMADVKAKYVTTLIALFEEKASKGEVDEKLMERIERLLGAL